MRIGWVAGLALTIGCKDPGGVPVVRSELGPVQKTPHFLTDLIVLTVSGQDLARVESETGLSDVIYSGVTSSWPQVKAETALVHTINGDVERITLEGVATHLLYDQDPDAFNALMSDPYGKFMLWYDAEQTLHSRDLTYDVQYTYPIGGVDLKAVPRAVASTADEALVQELGASGAFYLVGPSADPPVPVELPAGFEAFDVALGVNGVRIAGLDALGERVQISDEHGTLVLDMPMAATWLGRAAMDENGSSILSWEEDECLVTEEDVCTASDSVLVRYQVGQKKREILGRQHVVGQGDLIDRDTELSPDGDRLLLQSARGLWFVGNPDA